MKQTVLIVCLFFVLVFQAQEKICGFQQIIDKYKIENPESTVKVQEIKKHTLNYINSTQNSRNTIHIPVVFHVLYQNNIENISDVQIQSQLEILNKDFRRLNSDANSNWSQAIDTEIEFCLATIDPQGNPTNGVTRTMTNVNTFNYNTDNIKFSNQGGKDAWNTNNYLNIWVGDIGNSLLGYATPPGFSTTADGVVISYTCFGNQGTAQSPFNLGRTATHEIGHYLNLNHIWGEFGGCNDDDGIADTPNSSGPYYDCPTNPFSCGSTDMTENFMDYVDDACMNLFTLGQKQVMQSLFSNGGAREGLINSNVGCALSVSNINEHNIHEVHIYPNPVSDELNIVTEISNLIHVKIYDISNKCIIDREINFSNILKIDLINLKKGIYSVMIETEKGIHSSKLIKE